MRNSRYPEQEGYNLQETYRSGSNRRNYSPHHNMTNASALKLHCTVRLGIHRKMRWITGWETSEEQSRGTYVVHI